MINQKIFAEYKSIIFLKAKGKVIWRCELIGRKINGESCKCGGKISIKFESGVWYLKEEKEHDHPRSQVNLNLNNG